MMHKQNENINQEVNTIKKLHRNSEAEKYN